MDFGKNEDTDENSESEHGTISSASEKDSSDEIEESGGNESSESQSYTSDNDGE